MHFLAVIHFCLSAVFKDIRSTKFYVYNILQMPDDVGSTQRNVVHLLKLVLRFIILICPGNGNPCKVVVKFTLTALRFHEDPRSVRQNSCSLNHCPDYRSLWNAYQLIYSYIWQMHSQISMCTCTQPREEALVGRYLLEFQQEQFPYLQIRIHLC